MSKNMVEPDRPQMTIWRRVACWMSKATRAQAHTSASKFPPPPYTHTEYVILNAFPPQQLFRERASMLRYAYIACLVVQYLQTVLI